MRTGMNKNIIKLLEFEKIKNELTGYCFSGHGRELIFKQEVLTDHNAVLNLIELSVSLKNVLTCGRNLPAPDFPDIKKYLRVLKKKGTVLEGEDLACIKRYLHSSGLLKKTVTGIVKENRLGCDELIEIINNLPDLSSAVRKINRIIEDNGEIKEKQIPELAHIKSRINKLYKQVDRTVSAYLNDPSFKKYLQTDQPGLKDGRTVLPLKSNFKGKIKGIVHEVSSSGATVFIEPFDIVEKNNEIFQEQKNYSAVVIRVLRELTEEISEYSEEIEETINIISFFDSLYARADYARKHNCFKAVHSESGIKLVNARHPLLGNNAIPISVNMDQNTTMLIITGPNTGGKTVSLKTAGLLCIMNQFGMEIPADEGSELAVFDNVFADIGDEQSIEQSLSTFSGHIKNLSEIISQSTENSLVLLDELGAGTDPEEGVAIAMALLDCFIDKGCVTLATTHHGILKNYGYTRDRVQNACMEFNTETLSPTYKILIGIPGESHAIEIARQHGIPEKMISKALNYLNDERNDITELIRRLSEKHKELLKTEQSQKQKETELNEAIRNTDLKELRLRQRELELREHGLKDMSDFLDSSRKKLELLIKEIREGEISREKTKKAKDFIQDIEKTIKKERKRIEPLEEDYENMDYSPGMEVKIKGTGKNGILIRKAKKNAWVVETENMRITMKPGSFYPAKKTEDKNNSVQILSTKSLGSAPALELHLRGLPLKEAMELVEKQFDNAIIHGFREFSIIHGKGEGIIRRAVHEYLKNSSVVKDFYYARPELGGFGKTIVKLDV
jgi:DNA mismatch repair protein MutS2